MTCFLPSGLLVSSPSRPLLHAPAAASWGSVVTAEYILGGFVAALAMVYLFYVLIRPEKF